MEFVNPLPNWVVFRESSRDPRRAEMALRGLPDWPAQALRSCDRHGSLETMTAPMSIPKAGDSQGELVRKQRLQADGLRPLAMNLRETISLTRKLFELRDAARRAR
jgi:hypothetical protein